ncbi:hypothetical protein Cni_G29277 [Canna indica]|uniref:Uncharacterized protein n=1 Tax=Canna indica TaxID=4628 RepID=A0AAQ3L417_9LILI|nr:hypothetical protein Cni_G29277 [Canna indica]
MVHKYHHKFSTTVGYTRILRGAEPYDELVAEVDAELENQNQLQNESNVTRIDREDEIQGEIIRDGIAADMWNDYVL